MSERETVIELPWDADSCPCVVEAANRVTVGIRDSEVRSWCPTEVPTRVLCRASQWPISPGSRTDKSKQRFADATAVADTRDTEFWWGKMAEDLDDGGTNFICERSTALIFPR